MTEQNQTMPPPELFKRWEEDILNERENVGLVLDCAWKNGFRAGADQELEACCEWLSDHLPNSWVHVQRLRAARRPKPLSLKELALKALETEDDAMPLRSLERGERFALIRRALETLDD